MEREFGEVQDALADLMRQVVSAAMRRAELAARAREQEARDAAAKSEAATGEARSRLRAEREAAMPLMRQAWDDRWWRRVGADPHRLGPVWQAATEWAAADDPYAQATLQHLRREVAARYGIEAPGITATADELVAALTAPPPAPETETPPPAADATAAEATAPTAEPSWYRVVVRRGPTVVEHPLHAYDVHGTDPRVLAARHLARYGETHALDNVRVEVSASTIDGAEGPLLAQVTAADHRQVLADDEARRRAEEERRRELIANPAGGTPDELAAALSDEARRLRRQADALHSEALPHDPADPRAARLNTLADALRARADGLAVWRDAVRAEQRGEDPATVHRAARLRAELDTPGLPPPSPHEMGGIWDHVQHWPDGQARTAMLDDLRRRISEQAAVDIARDASGVRVTEQILAAHAAGPRVDVCDPTTVQALRAAYAQVWGRALDRDETAELVRLVAEGFTQPPRVDVAAAAFAAAVERSRAAVAAMPDREAAEAARLADEGFSTPARAAATRPEAPDKPRRRGGPNRATARARTPRGRER
ncbi:hypothetical protein [Yinghuangia sp. YIM S10712]|uniref:hypothetical protein n=1 Tax=Yinghuangia sp. YIM S10712 TaxID=3436930 RepID=UPI003F52926B